MKQLSVSLIILFFLNQLHLYGASANTLADLIFSGFVRPLRLTYYPSLSLWYGVFLSQQNSISRLINRKNHQPNSSCGQNALWFSLIGFNIEYKFYKLHISPHYHKST